MAGFNFDRPVKVIFGNVTYVVTNTRQAADLLLLKWPIQGSPKVDAARRAVMIAMGAPRDPILIKKARKTFADAAEEAGILMPD